MPDQQQRSAACEVQAILAAQGGASQEDAVEGMLQFINTNKLAQNKPLGPMPQQGQQGGSGKVPHVLKWVQPSGALAGGSAGALACCSVAASGCLVRADSGLAWSLC